MNGEATKIEKKTWQRMNVNQREFINVLIQNVVGFIYEVTNVFGVGFVKKVEERALL